MIEYFLVYQNYLIYIHIYIILVNLNYWIYHFHHSYLYHLQEHQCIWHPNFFLRKN